MINWDLLRENNSLEDFYNILYRNKPHRNSKLYAKWDYLESITYEILLDEENESKNEKIIEKIIEFFRRTKERNNIIGENV